MVRPPIQVHTTGTSAKNRYPMIADQINLLKSNGMTAVTYRNS